MYYYRNKKLAELYISDTKIAIDYPNYQDYNEISEEQFNLLQKGFDYENPTKDMFRSLRERDCFPIINRGQLWYQTLTEDQLIELNKWYKDWLDVTKTLVIPTKPSWLE